MNTILLFIVASAAAGAVALAGCATGGFAQAHFYAGIWNGRGEGYGGPILVEVETGANQILGIRLIEENEDSLSGGEAIRELISLILEYDSTDIDAISGATITSEGLLYAVDDALSRASIKRRLVSTKEAEDSTIE
jgi:urocanate reductase